MKSFSNRGRTVLIVLFAAILVFSAISSIGNAGRDDHSVPFKATAKLNAVVVGQVGSVLEIIISGSGQATHMGKISAWQHHFVDLATMTFYDGRWVWTAANGDTIEGGYYGTLVPTSVGFKIASGHFWIDGGTGRFENAVGEGTPSGVQYFDNTADLRLDGTMTFQVK
jgi:hypothetical protein